MGNYPAVIPKADDYVRYDVGPRHNTILLNATDLHVKVALEHPNGSNLCTIPPHHYQIFPTDDGKVTAKVFDSSGKQVATMVDNSDRSFIVQKQGDILTLKEQKQEANAELE